MAIFSPQDRVKRLLDEQYDCQDNFRSGKYINFINVYGWVTVDNLTSFG